MQTIEQLELALKIAKENLEWEYRTINYFQSYWSKEEIVIGPWIKGKVNTVGVLTEVVSNPGKELRIKEKEFPALPPGYSWYNPENLKPNDIPTGFRLVTQQELGSTFKGAMFTYPGEVKWRDLTNESYIHNPKYQYTYIFPIARSLLIEHKFV